MADVSHLEKMGRELKCPICLSLLNSAVSLTCNHVFCGSCISMSIKRASDCPVCKVPYHRREVRPAPHMDNLVSIYKSMEIASGVNIFVTPPKRSSDCKRQGGNESNFVGPKVRKLNRGKSKKQKSVQQNEAEDRKITNSRISDSQTSGKSSFSANKRVQVLPLPDASMLPQTIPGNRGERELNKNAGQECAKDCSNSLNEKPAFEGNGDSLFCPFFWLKETEENEENSDSQSCHVTDDECTVGTPRHIPSFSDIKDSQSPNTIASKECDGTSKAVDFHDSEMFEWTQRACSPELFSTPLKKQENHGLTFVEMGSPILSCKQAINSNAGTATTKSNARCKQLKQKVGKPCLSKLTNGADKFVDKVKYETLTGSGGILEEFPTLPRIVAENSSEENESAENVLCVNLGRKRSERGDIKHSKRNPLTEEVTRKSRVTAKNPNEANEIEEIGRSPNLGRKGRKRGGKFIDHPKRKHVKLSISQIDEGPKDEVVEESPKIHQEDDKGPGNENQPVDTLVKRMSRVANDGIEELLDEIPNESREIVESPNQGRKHTENICKRVSKRRVKDRSRSKRNQMEDTVRDIGQEVPTSDGQEVGNRSDEKIDPKYKSRSEGHLTSLTAIMAGEVSTELPTNTIDEAEMDTLFSKLPLVEVNNERTSGQENTVNKKGNKVKTKFQRRKARTEDQAREATTKVNTIDAAVVEDSPTVARENTENWVFPSVHDKHEVVFSAKNHQLQKCNEIPRKMPCAFCRSCHVSELTGEMVHYLSGKLIPAEYSGGSHVIQSHKKCAEWAPNVYFEEDEVMNLEAEISRSRRIKCSCCGIKGAALGCFDKGCRKSFHVPCAKMTPQCRWDDENFVMLCPLHSSSSLPKETPEQKKSRKQQDSKVERSAEVNCQWTWPSGSPKKWVLCCSSLNAEEKDSVSKLIKLAGLSLAKTWNPAVTHVIASTDENGACKRTLKFLMGILDGKWVLKTDWVKACLTALQPVNEEKYEIEVDIHGVKGGPREGRQRVINKEPKLFHELEFYFVGEFTNSYKGYLHDLVIAGGGVVLHRRPISRIQKGPLEESSQCMIYVIYSLEQPEKSDAKKSSRIFARRKAEASAIASTVNAKMAPHSWILDSIAASKLQVLDENTA
ncbi:protein BREAST CANCER SUSCEPTIBILITY 1 homolog [Aristolochia californica]|uniref:protein BREAST CANCER SUSCEPTIBILITY 1 homolog n=1 Tax=Aristolochia californica TaxID=171875 RepID=UPI0035DBBAA5